jgi:hypothetical protein
MIPLKNILILNGNLVWFWFFILLPPFVNLVGKVHESFWQEYYHQDQEHPDNDVTAKRKPGHFQPFPDNGENDGSYNWSGKGTQATQYDIRHRPEREIGPEYFRRDVPDVCDLECPGYTGEIGA